MDISTGLSVGSTLGGMALGAIGLNSQQRANEENMRLNKELLDFQKYQYEDMKRFNSMSSQVRRIRSANLNPSLMMQGGNLGTAGSQVASPSFNPYQPLDVSGVGSAVSSIADIAPKTIESLSESAKNVSEKTLNDIDAVYRGADNETKIDLRKMQKKVNESQLGINLKNLEFLDKSLANRLEQEEWKSQLVRAQAGVQLIAQKFAEPQAQANIAHLIMTAKAAILSGQANLKQAMASVMNAVTNRNNSNALYGINDSQRGEFFKATLKVLGSQAMQNATGAFKNLFQPDEFNGSIAWGLGSVGSSGTHSTGYKTWDDFINAYGFGQEAQNVSHDEFYGKDKKKGKKK